MRKSFLALAVSAGVFGLLNTNTVFAQVSSNGNGDISGTPGKPATIPLIKSSGDIFKFLGDRFHTLEIDTKAYEMQKDGVTERSYVAGFTIKGALVYNHELTGDEINSESGKNAGMQILPYTVSMTEDGRTFVSVTGFAMKNMITASSSGLNAGGYNDNEYGGAFEVIDNLQALIFEYDKNYMVEGIESYKLKFASIDMKLDLLGSSKPGTFLALTGGGDIGLHKTVINKDGERFVITGAQEHWKGAPDGSTYYSPKSGISGFNASVRYGLEYNTSLNRGWNINAKLGAEHIWSNGKADNPVKMYQYGQDQAAYEIDLDAYPQNLAEYNSRKAQYEQQNLNGTQISNGSYTSLTGDQMPTEPVGPTRPSPEQLNRALFYMTPSINFSKRISKEGKRPVRLGVGVYGNLPMNDATKGVRAFDLTTSNRELFGAKLFINF